MDEFPSTSSGQFAPSSIRRRAGAFSLDSGSWLSSSSICNDPVVIQVEDVDCEPTVKLVTQSKQAQHEHLSPSVSFTPWPGSTGLGIHADPVPEDPPRLSISSTLQAILDAGFAARPIQDAHPSTSRTDSSFSGASSLSPSIKPLKCPPIFGELSTESKLTSKFPISRTVKKLKLAAVVPEDAPTLGIDRIDRWTMHKWCLFLSLCTVFCYGTAGLTYAVMTWFKTWEQADVMHVADYDILVLITLASSLVLMTFVIGITGTMLNSRPILAVYALLLWPALISVLAVGYTSYKRYAFALDRKLNLAWSQWYSSLGRLNVQDTLRCCGYYSPLHEASASPQCYARSPLPGCKGKLLRFEQANLRAIWLVVFSILVPLHIANIFVSLLCANHVTRTFGKGIIPRQYRLRGADVKADAEKIMGMLRRIGTVARPALSRSPASAMFRADKADVRAAMEALPACLRPGHPKGFSSETLARKQQ